MAVSGIKSAAQLARESRVNITQVCGLLNFQLKARKKNGEWKSSTLKVCSRLGIEPEEIFPEYLEGEIITNKFDGYVEGSQIGFHEARRLNGPVDVLEKKEQLAVIEQVLETLPKREGYVIRRRFFENATIEEVGQELDLSRERIRQIEMTALRRIRNTDRIETLKKACIFK